MKSLFIVCLISFIAFSSAAQQITYKTIYQDTIHLRGVVLDIAGKPVANVNVGSRNLSLDGKGTLNTSTDSLGRFELIGARPNDTINVNGITNLWVTNNGSRYMEITLPLLKTNHINDKEPILLTAIRKTTRKKIPVKFEVVTDDCLDCGVSWEQQAEFPGGMDRFIKYIKSKLRYPEQAVNHGVEGMVQIAFSIYKDGSVINVKVLRGIGYGCDETLIKILKTSPKWKPAIANGRALIYPESVSVQFKLTDK
ncbi:MAG: TonB family protein [Bacteroidota bacterium]